MRTGILFFILEMKICSFIHENSKIRVQISILRKWIILIIENYLIGNFLLI